MLDYYEALNFLLKDLPSPKHIETRSLLDAIDLVLAEDIVVRHHAPLFDNSAMDGYALGGDLSNIKEWKIISRVIAGDNPSQQELQTGEAIRIFTGAPVPKGTSTILIQEQCDAQNAILRSLEKVEVNQNIRRQGEEFKKGDLLLLSQKRLTPAMIALLSSQGYTSVKVFSPPKICIFSTGNELINPEDKLMNGKIYDANRFLLLSWLKNSVFEVVDGGILPDDYEVTRKALSEASQKFDIIITSGGVSVGEEDHVKEAINQLGTINFWKLAIKPGKPFGWGEIGNALLFMLPGNPVSSLVTFQQLVSPALRVLLGENRNNSLPKPLYAKAGFEHHTPQKRREFIRVQMKEKDNELYAYPLPQQGSSLLSSCTNADALLEIPPKTTINQDDPVLLFPLNYKV